MRELQQAVAQLTQLVHDYITATDARLEQIEARLARLEGDVTELKAGQARLEGNVNRLIGSDYERKAARRASRLAQRNLSLRDLHVIYAITTPDSNRLPELLDRAVAAGRIDADEADDLENVDVILAGPDHYVVAGDVGNGGQKRRHASQKPGRPAGSGHRSQREGDGHCRAGPGLGRSGRGRQRRGDNDPARIAPSQ